MPARKKLKLLFILHEGVVVTRLGQTQALYGRACHKILQSGFRYSQYTTVRVGRRMLLWVFSVTTPY